MKKHLVLAVRVLVLAVVAVWLGKELMKAWGAISAGHVMVDWRWGVLSVAGFCGSMLTSAMVWRVLAGRMGERGGKRLPTVPLIGAYTFSQMGKYVPGKVALILMRIDRAGRFGMRGRVCVMSTLMENAIYMISGGLAGMAAIARVSGELNERVRPFVWPATAVAVIGLLTMCHPRIFYGLVNGVLKKMKRQEVGAEERLTLGAVALAVVGFVPCWVFGGVALWAAAASVHPVEVAGSLWFAGAYALSVIIGMASPLPGGLGIREAVLVAALTIAFAPDVGHEQAVNLALVSAGLQRIYQVGAEVLLGVIGGMVTGVVKKGDAGGTPTSQ